MSGEVDKWSAEQCVAWLFEDDWIRPFTQAPDGSVCSGWRRRDGKPSGLTWGHDPKSLPLTIDAAASAMPEGCLVQIEVVDHKHTWAEYRNPDTEAEDYTSGGTELEARFRLAVKARMAGGGGGKEA